MSEICLEGEIRQSAFKKLKVFISNPGKFSLLVLGSRGTGKHFAIENAFKRIKENDFKDSNEVEINNRCIHDLKFIDSVDIPNNADDLNAKFEECKNQTIVIEDVEALTVEQQVLLFDALSTTNGNFGLKGEEYNVRLVFTSSKDVEALREEDNFLQGNFWDRISQLIVEFPSFDQENDWVTSDFQSVWEKMKFDAFEEYKGLSKHPKNAYFEKFLQDNSSKFSGGFRDLDKIACMYFNYRILIYADKKKIDESKEKDIVENVKNDFFSKSQLRYDDLNSSSTFRIMEGFSMTELKRQFNVQVRKWAKDKYGTIVKAEVKLGLKRGTMKNYKPVKNN